MITSRVGGGGWVGTHKRPLEHEPSKGLRRHVPLEYFDLKPSKMTVNASTNSKRNLPFQT